MQGYNDLATEAKGLLDEWDYLKNYPLTPSEVTAYSTKKVWWKCSACGYEWEKTIRQMYFHPLCSNCHIRYDEK